MKSIHILFIAVALFIILTACSNKSLNPIFYTLENERALSEDRGLEDEMTIHEVVKAGSKYFAAANTLYARTDSGNWSVISPPVAGALCNTIEEFGGNLYAAFYTTGGSGLGLYYTDPDTISWNQVPDANVQNVLVNFVKAAGPTYLFVSREGGSSDYSLWYSDDPTLNAFVESLNLPTFPPGGSVPVTDVEHDGANYWVIAGPYLYSGALNSLTEVAGGPTNPGTVSFGGLLYTTQMYLSTRDGDLWSYNGAWTGPTNVQIDGEDVRFTGFVDTTGVTSDILVGTEGSGYYELIGGDQTTTQRRPDYNLSALYNGAINSFYLDTAPDPDILFACTSGAGLWRADYTAGEWEWVQE